MASHCHRRPLSTALAVEKQMLCSPPANSALHAPFPDGCVFDISEEEVLDEQSDQDDRSEAGVDLRDLQLLLVHEDEPADAARAAADTEHQLAGEDRKSVG